MNDVVTFSKKKINKAGDDLISPVSTNEKRDNALITISKWRALHAYPVNTFQATLRKRLKNFGAGALVAQRLKRIPSIENKLKNNKGMRLSRMQDIGGLRAVVSSVKDVRELERRYTDGSLTHELIGIDDYINSPKESGYRSLHLKYKYNNPNAVEYRDLHIELQIRTKLQHAWATAVETISSFLNQPLKASEGPQEWLNFFKIASAAFAHLENCPVAVDFSNLNKSDILRLCASHADALGVRSKLNAYVIAANAITNNERKGKYQLIVLDADARTVRIRSYPKRSFDQASTDYVIEESAASKKGNTQVVLVATGSIESLRRAYPNYFLDTREFLKTLLKIDSIISKLD